MSIQAARTAHHKVKQENRNRKGDGEPTKSNQTEKSMSVNFESYWNCSASTTHALTECTAHGQNYNKYVRLNLFTKVCKSQAKKDAGSKNEFKSIHTPSANLRVATVATGRMIVVTLFSRHGPIYTVQLSCLPDFGWYQPIPLTTYQEHFSGFPSVQFRRKQQSATPSSVSES